jgi:transcriptional regulator with XRE-family HTH domain
MTVHRAAKLSFRMMDTSLGAELKRKRGTQSLREIAVSCGVSFSLLARIERDEVKTPSRETLQGIAAGYGLPLEYLAQLVYLGDPEAIDHSDSPANKEAVAV